jgi:pimeloyl-ACP methyl ester carboxylesterase
MDSGIPVALAPRGSSVARPIVAGSCFGWLHAPADMPAGDVAVLMCPGLNWDRLRAHHSLRTLADELAMVGYPVMRFDYPGTGDSGDITGDEASPAEHWRCWQQSIHAMLDRLRTETGARRVILCGVRIGAALATLVAEQRDDLAALVLLAPVLRGRSYVQQLQMQGRLESHAAATPGHGLEFHELLFSAETVERIAQTDLRDAKLAPGLPVAMFMQSPSRLGTECERAWSERGARVLATSFDCVAPMLQRVEGPEGTPIDFSPVVDWIQRATPARGVPAASASVPVADLARPGWVETPRRFGPGGRLFGVLCRPECPASDMAVIICNTGQNPHYGVARFGVQFARDLARSGYASLRMDFAGLGDSLGVPGKENVETAEFDTDRTADMIEAVDLLTQLGYRRIAAQGICSGAYHALQGALAEPRIGALLLVNLPVLQWQTGDDKEFVARKTTPPSHYLQKVVSLEAWRRQLREFDAGAIIHAQCARLYERMREAAFRLAERRGWIEARSPGRRAMATLSRRHTRTFFLFSSDDHGVDAMEQEFGGGGSGLSAFPGTMVEIIPNLDHILSARPMRATAIDLMLRFLTRADGAGAGHDNPGVAGGGRVTSSP